MSIHSIHQYLHEVERIIHFGGSRNETSIRNEFHKLLGEYAKQKGLMMVPEVTIKATNGKNVTPDGTLKDSLRQDWGYWESKDESDDINVEIEKKFAKGYPKENILFEDSKTAVLIQNGVEVGRVPFSDHEALHRLLTAFISFERPEVVNFRKAIEHFKEDIPKVTSVLREIIITAERDNPAYVAASDIFLKLCHDSINPSITRDDIREMIIQHILTEDIFNTIFDETQFHRENNIARQLEGVIKTFFTGDIRRTALGSVQHYYKTINAAAAGIADHHEKQKFLKVVYETFYKSYNPKAADRLGVVYTPNEIVRFMIESTDYLLHKHFNTFLEDRNVEILDIATGTGTIITDLIDYIRKEKLEYKYKHEIHANEVAILPYYISNLNIEFTYAQKMGKYQEFENLCFVDTLDNMGFAYKGKQSDMFAPFTEENTERIRRQNQKKIAVILGNPPYNANQQNENDNNKNREYPEIDKRIKDTFIKQSTAHKTKLYDMYARFYRWAFDRLEHNGVIAFITNRSFIDSRTFDGFRKTIQTEFDFCYIIDTKSDVRANPKIAGTTHNVFGIQAGVAVMFLVKKAKRENETCKIHYCTMDDFWRKEEKLQWFTEHPLKNIPFEHIQPDKNNNWINLTENDWDSLLPVALPKLSGKTSESHSLFKLASYGTVSNRDEWVYDFSKKYLEDKLLFYINNYNLARQNAIRPLDSNWYNGFNGEIKWTQDVRQYYEKNIELFFENDKVLSALYRPYVKKKYYYSKWLNWSLYKMPLIYPNQNQDNIIIAINQGTKPFNVIASKHIVDLHFNGDSNCLPLYRYDSDGTRRDNITDWGFNQFAKRYGKKGMSKEAIFHYVYAVLHHPAYRTKYELNLKREFPRVPFYDDFAQWSAWGKRLMELHIGYESVEPFGVQRVVTDTKQAPKPKLKADKAAGAIIIDENTTLTGIPALAWEYKLGNRSALEWILDQYKESKPKDPTIAERFNTYKFSDYKEHVIDLLDRVCRVSVETMEIVGAFPSSDAITS